MQDCTRAVIDAASPAESTDTRQRRGLEPLPPRVQPKGWPDGRTLRVLSQPPRYRCMQGHTGHTPRRSHCFSFGALAPPTRVSVYELGYPGVAKPVLQYLQPLGGVDRDIFFFFHLVVLLCSSSFGSLLPLPLYLSLFLLLFVISTNLFLVYFGFFWFCFFGSLSRLILHQPFPVPATGRRTLYFLFLFFLGVS